MTSTASVQDKLTKLKNKYMHSLPGKISDIFSQWELCKTDKTLKDSALASQLHKLAGSAGMYELFELGEKARAIELTVSAQEGLLSAEIITEIEHTLEQLRTMVVNFQA